MPTIAIEGNADKERAVILVRLATPPFTMTLREGRPRSSKQNRLQHRWYKEAADQIKDMSADEYRRYCKLHFGVPILRAEEEDFREDYDRLLKDRPYEEKMQFMGGPGIEIPVTSIMTVKQHKKYLDDVFVYLSGLGVKLTDPSEI